MRSLPQWAKTNQDLLEDNTSLYHIHVLYRGKYFRRRSIHRVWVLSMFGRICLASSEFAYIKTSKYHVLNVYGNWMGIVYLHPQNLQYDKKVKSQQEQQQQQLELNTLV